MLSDLDQIERRLERVAKDLKKKKDAATEHEHALLLRCKAAMESEQPLRELAFTPDERKILTSFMFLSARPMLYVLNLGDNEVGELDTAVTRHGLGKLESKPQAAVVAVCGRIEAELAELDDAAAAELLSAYGLKESGLSRLIRATYGLMGLISFFTAGEPEVRAWTIRRGDAGDARCGRDSHRHRTQFHSRRSGSLRGFTGGRQLASGARKRTSSSRREGVHRPRR